jgi:hypothetical protein
MKTYTAVVKIGDGSNELGFYRNTIKVEALSRPSAKKKALQLALSSTFVTVELSEGREVGVNEVYKRTVGENPEPW